MAYTDIDKPSDYFTAFKWTGNGASSRALTGVGFQGDMLWSKPNTGHNHYLVDRVRGVDNKSLIPDATTAEDTNGTHGHFDSIDSDGFTGTLASGGYNFNRNALEFIAWIWKEEAGVMDIVTYTGNGSNRTIAHNLGVKPAVMIHKGRSNAYNWGVYHHALSPSNERSLNFNTTGAVNVDDGGVYYNSTDPTSSVFSLGNNVGYNENNATYVAYLFAEKQGYSKFGTYTGNGNADGNFIYTGFKPALFMIKRTDAAADWEMYDNKRDGFNDDNPPLYANTTGAEGSNDRIDILSNGFKIRASSGNLGADGGTYIYLAFAENPLVTSTGIPATAR